MNYIAITLKLYLTNKSDCLFGHSFHFWPVENEDVHTFDTKEAKYGNITINRVTDLLQIYINIIILVAVQKQ